MTEGLLGSRAGPQWEVLAHLLGAGVWVSFGELP